mmetsp:Transcript_117851/g.345270  ORF Transcript_117851/g.345270 Transcript_117851/m.345270 type:complete len:244 (+) Transcript_117851:1107-1838(+)
MQRVVSAPLQRVLHVLAPPPGHGQEGHVADAETAVAVDGAVLVVLAGVHGVVAPGVSETALVEHRGERVQEHLGRHRRDGLVDEPAAHARRGQVLLPRDHPHLLDAILDACPNVLHPEGAVAQDRRHGAVQVVVGHVVVHAVADVEVGLVLPGVVNDPWVEVGSREVVDNVGRDLEVGVLLHLRFDAQLVGTVGVRELAHNVQVPHFVLEGAVWRDAVSLCRVLDAGDDLVLLGPRGPLLRIA